MLLDQMVASRELEKGVKMNSLPLHSQHSSMTDIKGKAKQEQQDDDPLFDDVEFEKILNQEASLLSRESEVTN